MTDIALDEKALAAAKDVMRSGSGVLIMGAAFDATMESAIRAYLRASPSQVAPQPQAGEPIGYLVQGFDGGPFYAPDREQYDRQGHAVIPVYASPQPANPAQVTDAMVEAAINAANEVLKTVKPIAIKGEHVEFPPADTKRIFRAALTAAIGAGRSSEPEFKTAPDNGTPAEVLAYVLDCARRWVPEARIIGNARAGDIERAIAAIGAGGQAVAIISKAEAKLAAYAFDEDEEAEFSREDAVFVLSTLSQPHPAGERVVEALRIAEERLSSLLARIHRDGGHYEAAHGTEKAWTDADEIIARIYADDTHPAHSPAALASNGRGE